MFKIIFIGVGSIVFVKNILGDCMFVFVLVGFEFVLYDIDVECLRDLENMLNNLKENYKVNIMVKVYLNCREVLIGVKYVINVI